MSYEEPSSTDDFELSLQSIQHALRINPGSVEANNALGEFLFRSPDPARLQIVVTGGIGDFLLCTPFLLANRNRSLKTVVLTHFDGAASFFHDLAIDVERFVLCASLEQFQQEHAGLAKAARVLPCPLRWNFSVSPFAKPKISFLERRPVLGIHLGGSRYSIDIQRRFGLATKNLPVALLHAMASTDRFNIIAFGARKELESLGLEETARLKFACYERIADSLAEIAQCTAFLGSDSAIKTAAAMLGIPTVVWMASYPDDFRDKVHIGPFVEGGLMKIFYYATLAREVERGVHFTLAALRTMGV